MKDEHVELRRIGEELRKQVSGDTPADPGALASCRWRLARLLIQHLALEDSQIYGRARNPLTPLGTAAKRLKDELGDLYAGFQRHVSTWTGQAAAADWPRYRAETLKLIATLNDRIDREERELYPLVERDGTAQAA